MNDLLVSVVTWNSAAWLERCLESVRDQTIPVRIRIFDNASRDASVAIARRFAADILESSTNLGFCRGHNINLQADSQWRLAFLLNPDTRLHPCCLEKLAGTLARFPRAGMAGGSIFRMDTSGEEIRSRDRPVLDSTGIYFTPALRHFDRDSGIPLRKAREQPEQVFGVTGAALLCTREFVEDVSFQGEFLDEAFFAYREDADLAWRAQLFGWRALYQPDAHLWHARQVRPQGRRRLPPTINYHSVKNRFLMRIKNLDPEVRQRCFPFFLLRDLGIYAYLAAMERRSLAALEEVRRLRPLMEEKRRDIQTRRRVSGAEVAQWFSFSPVSRPL
jgi:GT2 family glycosyltransferase